MLALHLGAIRAAWSGLAGESAAADWAMGGLRLVILLASALFFALKMADVACLRLRPGWRPLIASVVVVAMLHVNVLHRVVERDETYAPAPVAAITLIGALVESSTLRRGVFRLARAAFGEATVVDRASPELLYSVLHARDPRAPLHIMLVSGLLLPRPPPAR